MSVFFTLVIAIAGIILGKIFLGKWFNHLSVYSAIWGGMVALYEINLLNYTPLSMQSWFVISGASFAFLFGVLTVISANARIRIKSKSSISNLFADGGCILGRIILIMSVIGIIEALYHWSILIKMFGDLASVFSSGNIVYQLRIKNKIPGLIPYISSLSYAAVFLSGIYSAYKNKINLISIMPLIAVILKTMALFGRAGMLFGFVEFIAAFMLYRHYMVQRITISQLKSERIKTISYMVLIFVIFLSGATVVKSVRGTVESYQSASTKLKGTQKGLIISPSIYLYFSSHVGVMSKYFEKDNEEARFGENTFSPIYNFLSKFGVTDRVSFYSKGYYIPMWTNTATYLREIHADFGVIGLFFVPFLLGALLTLFWKKFYSSGNIIYLVPMVYFFIVIMMSYITMITRQAYWYVSLVLLFLLIPLIARIVEFSNKLSRRVAR